MRTMNKQYPDTLEELLAECKALVYRYDLYTLGEPKDSEDGDSWPDGTEVDAGEWQYGVAMVPAQWITHVFGKMEKKND